MKLATLFSKHRFLKILGILIFFIAVLIAVGQLVYYVTYPRVHYVLKEANCSSIAIAERNKTLGYDSKACILLVSATNTMNKTEYINYEGDGFGGATPLIKVNTADGEYCYGSSGLEFSSQSDQFKPHQTRVLTITCEGEQHPSKYYDNNADSAPVSITITGPYGATINFNSTH